MRHQSLFRQPLGPEELKLAAKAFEGALERSAEFVSGMHPLTVRRAIASAVMEGALAGERDKRRLEERALFRLMNAHFTQGAKLELAKKEI